MFAGARHHGTQSAAARMARSSGQTTSSLGRCAAAVSIVGLISLRVREPRVHDAVCNMHRTYV